MASRKSEKIENIVIFLLLSITALAFVLQEYVLEASLTLDANSGYKFKAVDDRTNGGASIGTTVNEDGSIVLDCEIKKETFAWPYCNIALDLVTGEEEGNIGLDLSKFDRVGLWIKYQQGQHSVRFQTRNFNPTYAKSDDYNSWKYNAVEYFPEHTTYPIWIPLSSFQVPTWWLVSYKIPINLYGPEFDSTVSIEIATGNYIAPGQYKLVVEKIVFKGKYIDSASLYAIIIAVWMLFAALLLVRKFAIYRRNLREVSQNHMELEALYQLLNIKSQELQDKVDRDPLTGVLNRSGVAKIFEQHITGEDEKHQLSLMFIDIDFFKQINDTYGHNVGDEVIKNFADLINSNTRELDVLARWGGEEFILICPNTSLNQAAKLAENLRKQIQAFHWPELAQVTASFGVAHMRNETPTEFIERADSALYQAKKQGRNRVICAKD